MIDQYFHNRIHRVVHLSPLLLLLLVASSEGSQVWIPEFLMDEAGTDFDHRYLQQAIFNDTINCYHAVDVSHPNRYCTFNNTPRAGTFLVLSCPDSTGENLSECSCNVGVGIPQHAPKTPTCESCSFCQDGTLSFSCANVAVGTCIGRTCQDTCVESLEYSAGVASHFTGVVLATLGTGMMIFVALLL